MPIIKIPFEERHLITPNEVDQMIKTAPELKDKAIIALYYIFGVRRNEPLSIIKEDIWIDDKWFYIKIKREKMKKGSVLPRIDTLKVTKDTKFLSYIIELWSGLNDGDFLFSYHPNPATASLKIYHMIRKINPKIWIHLFRHTRNDYFRRKGYTREQRMAWFGWSDPRTPDKSYSHPAEKDIEEMGSKIE